MPTVYSFHISDPGKKRTNNEDAVGSYEPKDPRQLGQSGRLYVVADGLGGHQKGEQASQLVVDSLIKFYYENPDIPPEKRLRDIIQRVHQKLIAARTNLTAGDKMATTVVAAVVRNDTLQVAHVGDSRAYLIREGEIHQITRDHSFVAEMVRAGALTEEEAMRSPYRNRLTRSVGGSDGVLEVDITPPIPLHPGDLILLCTDGLTQYATRQDLLKATSHGTPRQIAERLVNFANARGGSDNITVCVIQYGSKTDRKTAQSPWRYLASLGAGALMLVILGLIGWYVLGGNLPPSPVPTATPTASSTQTATLTPEPTMTITPVPSATPTPSLAPITETAVPYPLTVDCEYVVQQGDNIKSIAARFSVNLNQILRQDDSREDLNLIVPGDVLIIKGTSVDVCQSFGRIVQPLPISQEK